jgi:hypothetical protein
VKRAERAGDAVSNADERLVESIPESGRGRRIVESDAQSRADAGCAACMSQLEFRWAFDIHVANSV